MTLGTWWGVSGSNLLIQGVNSICNPMFECLEWVSSKTDAFQFSPIDLMGRSQNWPDLRSPISKFFDIHFIDTVACSNRWGFQGNRSVGVALTNIQTFFMRWGHLTWPGDLTLRDLCLKFSHVRKIYMIRCAKNGGTARCRFLTIWKNGGGSQHPPSRARVNTNKNIIYFRLGEPLSQLRHGERGDNKWPHLYLEN